MHNTRSAIANLIKRYKAVLHKCYILNTFGSLAVATGLVLSCGVGAAWAEKISGATQDKATGAWTGLSEVLGMKGDISYTPTLANDSAYTVQSASINKYTSFTIYNIDEDGKPTDQINDILLKNEYAADATVSSVQDIITNYLSNYTSENTNDTEITIPGNTYFISYQDKQNTNQSVEFNATNTGTNKTSTRSTYTTDSTSPSLPPTVTENFVGIVNNAPPVEQYTQYSGGALSIFNDKTHKGNVESIFSVTDISGDFIGNKIYSSKGNIYQGNGGAIALFSNRDETSTSTVSITVTNVTGDFIGNSASRVGGAMYLFTNNGATTEVKNITGDFIANTAGLGGGAIANYEGAIDKITGSNFIGNTTNDAGGGAIDNMMWSLVGGHTATIGSIDADFIANTAGAGATIANGGAIRNFAYSYGDLAKDVAGSATIETITADFIANSATGDGGAIYNYAHSRYDNPDVENEASIGSITGDFIGNSAVRNGGAIFNDENYASTASIDVITGDFIFNTAGTSGGAIYNTSSLTQLQSNFVNNTAGNSGGAILNIATSGDALIGDNSLTTGTTAYNSDEKAINGSFIGNSSGFLGGALYNCANGGDALIGDITGDFVGNHLTGTVMALASGGAIANYSAVTSSHAMIGDINGYFLYNYATKYGGAIYNDSKALGTASIGDINGDFLYNYVDVNENTNATYSVDGTVGGGAIYNNDTIGTISGNFIGNYVVGNDDTPIVAGGAIYTTTDMNFVADGTDNYFSDNYTQNSGSTKNYNAIYVGIDTILVKKNTVDETVGNTALNFTMSNSGNFVMNDSISGNTEYTPLTVAEYTGATASVDTANKTITITDSNNNTLASQRETSSMTFSESTKSTTTYTPEDIEDTTAGTTTSTIITAINDGSTTTYIKETVTVQGDNILSSSSETVDYNTVKDAIEDINTTSTSTTVKTTTIKEGTSTVASYVETTNKDEDGDETTTISAMVNEKVTTTGTSTKTTLASDGKASKNDYGASTPMTGETAYDIVIKGDGTDTNTFYLNAEADNFGDFSIENATLFLSSYNHGDQITKGGLTALDDKSSVTFGTGSRLVIDMSAYSTSEGTVDALSKTAVLTGNGASLNIHDNSTLRITKATTGKAYTIAQGFNVGNIQDEYAWKAENISLDSSLQTVTILRDGYNDTYAAEVEGSTAITNYKANGSEEACYFVLAVIANPEDSALADSSVGEIIINAANTDGFGPNADGAGNRFIYEVSTVEGEGNQVSAVEGAANIAKASGVPTTTYRVNRLSSDALSTRLNGSGDTGSVLTTAGGDDGGLGELSKKCESTSLWFVPMYGHDVTDGAGLVGFDADFHTNIYGGVVGIDKTVDNDNANGLAADLYRVGVALNMGGGDTSASGDFDAIDNSFNFGGAFVYGVAEYGNLTLSADAGFNKIMSEVNQDLSLYGISGTKADVDSMVWSADLQAQYRFEGDTVDVIPYAGLEFVSMKTDNYNVTRADAAGGTVFTVASDRQNIISMPVGVKLDAQWTAFDDWLVTPQISLGAIFAMGDLDEHSSITMPNVAGDGHASMQVVDDVTFDMSTGLSIANDDWTFGLDYELQMSEHRTGHALVGLVQYKF